MNDQHLPASTSSGELEKTAQKHTPLLRHVDKIGQWLSPNIIVDAGQTTPDFMARKSISVGLLSIALFFGAFGLWSAFAPINSAAIAMGKVVLDSNKKTVQHLEGGIVDAIKVREGQKVVEGQVLIKLDETAAKARYELLRKQFVTAQATQARLLAERDDKDAVIFPDDLLEARSSDETVKESIDAQTRLFAIRRKNITGRESILQQKIGQSREEIRGLNSQISAASNQIGFLNEEIAAYTKLVASGNAPKSRLLALKRQKADLSGNRGEYRARISRAEQNIGESELEIINVSNGFLNEVNEELKETRASLSDLEERIRASQDTFQRVNIVAPLDGTVTDLLVHTIGGVIKPGEKILDIIPSDDKLIVEARVEVQDIDVVHKGMEASIRLSAYKARFVPPIAGEVVNVSADRFEDNQSGSSFYLARIVVDSKELEALDDVALYPGMPADVLIVTGSRTLLAYLFAPIRESFSKAIREE